MVDRRSKSLTESLANIAVGYPLNHVANMLILVPFARTLTETYDKNGLLSLEFQMVLVIIGILYTVVSIIRSYFLRRLFERFGENENGYTLLVRLYRKIKHKIL